MYEREVFQVGAVVGYANGGGRLVLATGSATLVPGPITRRASGQSEYLHSDKQIVLVTARLLPPWMNTHLVLVAGSKTVLAGLPGWSRRRLRRALARYGFEVVERKTLFGRGAEMLRW